MTVYMTAQKYRRVQIEVPKTAKRWCPNKCGFTMSPQLVSGITLDCYPPIHPAAFVCDKCGIETDHLSYCDGKFSMYLFESLNEEIPMERFEILEW